MHDRNMRATIQSFSYNIWCAKLYLRHTVRLSPFHPSGPRSPAAAFRSTKLEIWSHDRRTSSIKLIQPLPAPRAEADMHFRYERQRGVGHGSFHAWLHGSTLHNKGHLVLVELDGKDAEPARSSHFEIGLKSATAECHVLSSAISVAGLLEEFRDELSGLRQESDLLRCCAPHARVRPYCKPGLLHQIDQIFR